MDRQEYIIPADLLLAIVKAAHAHAGQRDDRSVISGILIEVDPATRKLRFVATDGYRMLVRSVPREEQIEGAYPNYRQIMPETFRHAVTVDRKALLAATKAMPGAQIDGCALTLTLNGHMEFAGTDKAGNKLSQTLPLAVEPRHDDAPEVTITFDSRYLADSLRAMDASRNATIRKAEKKLPDTVTLRVNGPVQAATITAGDEASAESEGVTTLLMPIRQ